MGWGAVGSVWVECGPCGLHPGTCLSHTPAPRFFTSSRGLCFLPPFKARELSPLECSLSFLGICPGGDTCVSVSISPQTPVFPRGGPGAGVQGKGRQVSGPGVMSLPGLPAPWSWHVLASVLNGTVHTSVLLDLGVLSNLNLRFLPFCFPLQRVSLRSSG